MHIDGPRMLSVVPLRALLRCEQRTSVDRTKRGSVYAQHTLHLHPFYTHTHTSTTHKPRHHTLTEPKGE